MKNRILKLGLAVCLVLSLLTVGTSAAGESERVLLIGSTETNAVQYLGALAKEAGKDLEVAALIKKAGTLRHHASNLSRGIAEYAYYTENSSGVLKSSATGQNMATILAEGWDVVILEQYSEVAGFPGTYNSDLRYLVDYLNTNYPDTQVYWNMTWAGAPGTGSMEEQYENDQVIMNNAIGRCVNDYILPFVESDDLAGCFYVGAAVQDLYDNGVTAGNGYTLYRAGYLTAAMTVLKTLYPNVDLGNLNYSNYITSTMRTAANNAAALTAAPVDEDYEKTDADYLANLPTLEKDGADGTPSGYENFTLAKATAPLKYHFPDIAVLSNGTTLVGAYASIYHNPTVTQGESFMKQGAGWVEIWASEDGKTWDTDKPLLVVDENQLEKWGFYKLADTVAERTGTGTTYFDIAVDVRDPNFGTVYTDVDGDGTKEEVVLFTFWAKTHRERIETGTNSTTYQSAGSHQYMMWGVPSEKADGTLEIDWRVPQKMVYNSRTMTKRGDIASFSDGTILVPAYSGGLSYCQNMTLTPGASAWTLNKVTTVPNTADDQAPAWDDGVEFNECSFVAPDPDSNTVYAFLRETGAVMRSYDRGVTWTQIADEDGYPGIDYSTFPGTSSTEGVKSEQYLTYGEDDLIQQPGFAIIDENRVFATWSKKPYPRQTWGRMFYVNEENGWHKLDDLNDGMADLLYQTEGTMPLAKWFDTGDPSSKLMPNGDILVVGYDASYRAIVGTWIPMSKVTVQQAAGGTVSVDIENGLPGEVVTISAVPVDGFEVTEISVNGAVIDGNTFVMPEEDVTVTAVFCPEGAIFYEGLNGYEEGEKYPLNSTANFTSWTNTGTAYTYTVAKEDDNNVLKLTATDSNGTTGTRIGVKTNEQFSGSYAVQVKVKTFANSNLSAVRLFDVEFPISEGNGDCEVRINENDIYFYLKVATSVNMMGEDSSTKLYFYDDAGSKVTVAKDTWYTVKIMVDAKNNLVVGELYNAAGVKLGSRMLVEATKMGASQLALDHFSMRSNSGKESVVYFDDITVTSYEPPTYYTVTAGNCANGSISVNKTMAAAGENVTVIAKPDDGYEFKGLVVNGILTQGNTFVMEESIGDVTVLGRFWPAGAQFYEDFDLYDEGAYAVGAAGANLKKQGATAGTHTETIVDEDGDRVLKVTVVDDGSAGTTTSGSTVKRKAGRSWLLLVNPATGTDKFTGDFIVEARFKHGGAGSLTGLRMQGVYTPTTDGKYGYEQRIFDGGDGYVYATRSTQHAAGESSGKLYLYDEKGTKVTFTPDTWYVIKIHVGNGAVVTEVYNDAGALLGSRTLTGMTMDATGTNVGFDIQSTSGAGDATGNERWACWDYVTVKEYECPHVNTTAAGTAKAATCTETGLTEGKKCSVCGEVLRAQAEIPALGHDLVKYEGKEPTLDSIGWTEYETCSRCDYTTYVEMPTLEVVYMFDTNPAYRMEMGEVYYVYNTKGEKIEITVANDTQFYKGFYTYSVDLEGMYTLSEAITNSCFKLDQSFETVSNTMLFTSGIDGYDITNAIIIDVRSEKTIESTDSYVVESFEDLMCMKNIEKANIVMDVAVNNEDKSVFILFVTDVYVSLPACDHSDDKLTVTKEAKEATCTDAGWTEEKTCSCGEIIVASKPVEAKGHNLVDVPGKDATYTEPGYKAYKDCSRCDYTEGYEEIPVLPVPTGTIKQSTYTLSLDEVIFINDYVVITGFEGIDLAEKTGLMVFKTDVEEPYFDEELAIPGAVYDAKYNEWMVRTGGIAAKEYADELYVYPYVELPNGEYFFGEKEVFSVRSYCDKVFASATTRATLKRVCAAMLHYGAAAQVRFNYKVENLANAGLAAEWAAEEFKTDMLTATADFTTNIDSTGDVVKSSTTLSLDGAIVMNYYYKCDGIDVDKAELLLWYGETEMLTEANAANADEPTLMKYTYSTTYGAEYFAQSAGIATKKYGETIYSCVKVTDTDGGVHYSEIFKFSPEAYAELMLNNARNGELVKRMVVYGEAAAAHFAK